MITGQRAYEAPSKGIQTADDMSGGGGATSGDGQGGADRHIVFPALLQFAFSPNAQGVDTQSDIDIFVVVPLPAGGAMAFVGLAGLASVRRRSN